MRMIVAVSDTWGIGYQNELLYHIPDDLKHFRALTEGSEILMGRKTWESLPKELPNRQHIVLSSQTLFVPPTVKVIHDLHDIHPSTWNGFCIGGASLYEQCLPYTDIIYVTHIHDNQKADTYFPNLQELSDWKLIDLSPMQYFHEIPYQFAIYKHQN